MFWHHQEKLLKDTVQKSLEPVVFRELIGGGLEAIYAVGRWSIELPITSSNNFYLIICLHASVLELDSGGVHILPRETRTSMLSLGNQCFFSLCHIQTST